MPAHKKWLEDKLALVEERTKQGLTASAIYRLKLSDLAGFSERAIQSIMSRFSFTDPIRSARRKKAKILSELQKDRLVCFLEGVGREKSNIEVTKSLGLQISSVEYFRKKLGQSVDRQQIFQSRSYKEACSRRMLEYGQELRNCRRELMEIKFRSLGRSSGRVGVVLKKCKKCKRKWPLTPYFFYPIRKQTECGVKVYFNGTCKICYNEARLNRRLFRKAIQKKLK